MLGVLYTEYDVSRMILKWCVFGEGMFLLIVKQCEASCCS